MHSDSGMNNHFAEEATQRLTWTFICVLVIWALGTTKTNCYNNIRRPYLSVNANHSNTAEIRMLRWARGKTRLDHIRNEDIRKEAHVKPVETLLENKRLKWFGHCLRREHKPHLWEIAKSFWEKEQWSTENRWSDMIKEDMKKYHQLTEYMAHDRKYWMTKVMAGPEQGDGQERWERWQVNSNKPNQTEYLYYYTRRMQMSTSVFKIWENLPVRS